MGPFRGVFDFAVPQSALMLASLVLSLGYQFDILRHELPARRLHLLPWRADNDYVPCAESIQGWRRAIDVSDNSR